MVTRKCISNLNGLRKDQGFNEEGKINA